MQKIYLQSESKYYGKLELLEMLYVEGVPIRADNYYVTYRLTLNDTEIEDSFSDRYLIHDELLFITSMDIAKNTNGEGRLCSTELHVINLQTHERKKLSRLTNGFVEAKSVEGRVIIYTKRRKASSAIHEFEQDIGQIWRV